jgi:endonuclease/exonuclease/phosphatase family metal-dependent hydrolase
MRALDARGRWTKTRPSRSIVKHIAIGLLTIMTRNLYQGTELTRAVTATNFDELMAANAQSFSNLQQTYFPERAKALAREIAQADPKLIGLQEVPLWLSGPLPRNLLEPPEPPTDVEIDFLIILRDELAAVGAPYDVVRVQDEAVLMSPAGKPFYKNIRLEIRDVILVKAGLERELMLSNDASDNFVDNWTLDTPFGPITMTCGWVSVDAVVDNNQSFRFVNTHLDASDGATRLHQAQELVAKSGPVGSAHGTVILAGDLNSDPTQKNTGRGAYSMLVAAGMVDAWAAAYPRNPGLTCCFSELLDDPSAKVFESRIDHILTKGAVQVVSSRITGTDPDNRTPGGLWPSDHAGLTATLNLL